MRREIDHVKAFSMSEIEQRAALEGIKGRLERITEDAPNIPASIWTRLDAKGSIMNKLIARIRSL